MPSRYDILIIRKDEVIESRFDDKFGPIIRVKHYDRIKKIDFKELLSDFTLDFLNNEFKDKKEMLRFTKEYFKFRLIE